MFRRRHLAVILGVFVVLAGCSGSPGGTGADPTTTGAQPTPSQGDPVATDGNGTYPDGTGPDGIENASALIAATEQRLAASDYTVTFSLEQRGGGQAVDARQRLSSSLDDRRRLTVFDFANETTTAYFADGTRYLQMEAGGETTHQRRDLSQSFAAIHDPDGLGGAEALGGVLRTGNYTGAGAVERDGRTLVRFELDEANARRVSGPVTAASGEVLVDADGVVYAARIGLELADGRYENAFGIDRLGDVTVERPDWVDRVPDGSG